MTEKIDNNFDKINNRSCNNNEQIDNKSCIIDTKNDKHIDNLNIESCTLHTKGDINTEQISNKSCIVKNDDEITTSSVIERMFRSTTSGSTESSSNKFIEHKLKTVRLRLKKLEDDLYIVLSTNKSSKIKSGYRTFIIAVGEDSVNSGSSTIIGFAKDFFTAPEEFFVIHSPRKISDRELFVEIIESSGFVLKSQIQSGVEPEMVSHVDDCAGTIDVQSGVELKAQTEIECVTDVTTDMTIEIDVENESRVESERQLGVTTDTVVATANEIVKIVKTKSGVVNSVEVENIMQTGIANTASLKSEFDVEIESDLNIKSGIEIKADITTDNGTDITSKTGVETELEVESESGCNPGLKEDESRVESERQLGIGTDIKSRVELKAQTEIECVTDVTTDMTIEIGVENESRVESERQLGVTTDTVVATANEIVKIVKTKSGVVNSVEVENIMQTGIANTASLKSEFDVEIESDLNIKSGIEIKADITTDNGTDITSKTGVETELEVESESGCNPGLKEDESRVESERQLGIGTDIKSRVESERQLGIGTDIKSRVENTKIILFRDIKFLKSYGSLNHNSYTKSNYKYCKLNNIIFETITDSNKISFDNDDCFSMLKDMDCLARRHWMGW